MHLHHHIWPSLQVFSIILPLPKLVNVLTHLSHPLNLSSSSAKFLAKIPLSTAATVIIPGEVIPNYKDLKTKTSNFHH